MKLEVEIHNGIVHVMNDGLKVDWMEPNHINTQENHYDIFVAIGMKPLQDLFDKVNVIGL